MYLGTCTWVPVPPYRTGTGGEVGIRQVQARRTEDAGGLQRLESQALFDT